MAFTGISGGVSPKSKKSGWDDVNQGMQLASQVISVASMAKTPDTTTPKPTHSEAFDYSKSDGLDAMKRRQSYYSGVV